MGGKGYTMESKDDTPVIKEGEAIFVHVTLASYLQELAGVEGRKPAHQRRSVPTITELADTIGISRVALSNLANDNKKLLNAETLGAVLTELRRRGFKTELSDILTAYAEPTETSKTNP
jgi:DNA-binding Xre family transcriptional regulator